MKKEEVIAATVRYQLFDGLCTSPGSTTLRRGDLMTHIRFTIHLPPVAQQRARSRAVVQSNGKPIAMAYKAGKQRKEERKLEAMLYEHRPPEPLTGQVWLGVKFFLQIPKSKSKKWKAEALTGSIRPCGKPDLSNLLKNIEDVGNGVFWKDDSLIVGYLPGTGKYYGEVPRYEVTIVANGE